MLDCVDPVSLIIAAVVAGATAAFKDTASAAVTDAYNGLKALIVRRFGAAAELEAVEADPEGDHSELRERLAEAAGDEEVLTRARELLARADPAKYQVVVSGGKGVVIGDNADVTMNFND